MTAVVDQAAEIRGAADQGGRADRLLMLTHRLPYPPDRGDRIRSYHMLRVLASHFEVAIACTSDEPVWLQHHQLLSTMAKRVAIQPISSRVSKIKSLAAMVSGRSLTPSFYYRQGLADTILQWDEEAPFDVILTFCTGMIKYASLLIARDAARSKRGDHLARRGGRIRHVLDLVDVDSLKWRSYARQCWPPLSWAYRFEARRLRRIEAGQLVPFERAVVVSDAEAQAYRQGVGDHTGLTVVGNGVDLDYFKPQPDSNSTTIVFVGVLNYRPNAEGITWFVQNVFARLRDRLGDVRLRIVGRHPTARIEELGDRPGVEVVGSVPDVRVYLQEASAVIAPLRMARGVQNKVLEAMACGRVVVCSPQAAEGLRARDGEHLLVADQPLDWVDRIDRVLSDTGLRQRVGMAARRHIEQHYSWNQCLEPIIALLKGEYPEMASVS